jgi:outer membrane protein OmpA-like peptidoglycan-associated protein
MRNTLFLRPATGLALAVALLATSACATKKYVGAKIAPIDQKVSDLEARDQKKDASIASLEQNVNRVEEQAQSAERRANEAAAAAAQANERALDSGQKAEQAQRAAGEVRLALDQRAAELEQKLAALDNFQLVGREVVLFGVGKSTLSEEAKRQLDSSVVKITAHKRYLLEVQGFADRTGSPALNLELSRRRAQEVVRYLNLEHKIPLFRIHVLGMGSAAPIADQSTKAGRRQNRRVEIRLYSADPSAQNATSARVSVQ